MSGSGPKKTATYQDLLDVPDEKVAEILDGDLFASPRPALRHALASSVLGTDLTSRFHGPTGGGAQPGGWWLLDEPELHLHDDVIVPDIAGWRRENVSVLPDAAWLDVAPDWACEVISPGTESIDRGRKMKIYGREGVGHLWLLNPIGKTLEIYRLGSAGWTVLYVFQEKDTCQAEPFAAVTIDLTRLWLPETPAE